MVIRSHGLSDGPDDLSADLANLIALQGGQDATNTITLPSPASLQASGMSMAQAISALGGQQAGNPIAGSAYAPAQTFTQWIEAHSTLLLVSFSAIGAVMAITRGRR